VFTLNKNGNLSVDVPVTIAEAALGAKIELPTLDGSVTVKVPAGTQHGKTLRVKGRGAPRPGGGAGDLLVKIHIEVPKKLTRKEKEQLEAFAAEHKGSPREQLEKYLESSTKQAS
jgi:molecular chaperone DnaJ